MSNEYQILLLVVAGVAAGLGGSIAGIASIFSYPALLAVGLSPIDANVTNSVSLFCLSAGSILGSRRELVGHGKLLKQMAPANLVGGVLGAILLLQTSSTTFRHIVPFLLLVASLAILIPRRGNAQFEPRIHIRVMQILAGLIGIYCGYFGAASGSMTLALMIQTLGVGLPVANALKNVLLGISNGVAAVIFMFGGHVHWLIAIPLAIGFFIGGRTGPIIVRHAPQKILQRGVSVFGIGVALWLLAKL